MKVLKKLLVKNKQQEKIKFQENLNYFTECAVIISLQSYNIATDFHFITVINNSSC